MREYFKKLMDSESKESSKRFLAFWFSLVLSFMLIWAVIHCEDVQYPIWITVCLIAALMGMSTYLSAKNLKKPDSKSETPEKKNDK